jgi:hypothetical protein
MNWRRSPANTRLTPIRSPCDIFLCQNVIFLLSNTVATK